MGEFGRTPKLNSAGGRDHWPRAGSVLFSGAGVRGGQVIGATDRRGEVPAGSKPYFEIPVFNWFAGRLSAIYQRQYIDSAQRFVDARRLSAQQLQALDLLDALTNDPALHFTMALQPGDVQFVHNHSLLHDRTAFVDWPEPERRRHLLRLWLAPESARPLPAVFAQRYGSVEPGHRGGVPSADGHLRAPG